MSNNQRYRIEVFAGADGWYWRLVSARNGQTLATSESYTRKASALSSAHAVVAYGIGDETEVQVTGKQTETTGEES